MTGTEKQVISGDSVQRISDFQRQQKDHQESLKRRVELLGLIVALIAALAGWGSWYESHLARIQSVQEAKQTRIDDERPFLSVELSPKDVEGTGDVMRTAHVRAFGKTPAVNVVVSCKAISLRKIDWKDLNGPVSLPGMPNPQTFPYIPSGTAEEVMCSTVEDHDNRWDEGLVTVFGLVRYEDISHNEHYQTPFCINHMSGSFFGTVATYACSTVDAGNMPPLQ